MTIVVQNVGRVRAVVESVGSFAVEASIGDFVDITSIEGTTQLVMERNYETPKLLQQYLHGYPIKVRMPDRATFSLSTNLRGALARSGDAITPTPTSVSDFPLFKTLFGSTGVFHGTGTTVATTSTTSVIKCTDAGGFLPGAAIVCATGLGGALECREIKSIATDDVTVKSAFSSVPANGSTVYACTTFYLSALDGSTTVSLQAVVEGLNTIDRWLLKGGQISAPPALKMEPGKIPTVDWAWMFAHHGRADGSEATMNLNTALANQNYANTAINAVMDSEFRLTPISTTVGVVVHASEINVKPNIAYEPHTTPGGTNNIKQWVSSRVDGPTVTGDFLLPYEDVSWRTAREAETPYSLTYQVGSSLAGGGFMMSVPHAIIDNWQREAVGGLAGQRAGFYARADFSTSGTSALTYSPLKIHQF